MLPAPRLIVWTGDPGEDPATAGALAVISRTYHAVIDHGWAASGITAGGNDWSGWHLPDAAHVDGLVDLVLAIAPRHWTVER